MIRESGGALARTPRNLVERRLSYFGFNKRRAPAGNDEAADAPQMMTSFQANSVMTTVTTVTVAPARLPAAIRSATNCPTFDIFETDSRTSDCATVRNYEHRRAISLGYLEDTFALVNSKLFVVSSLISHNDATSKNSTELRLRLFLVLERSHIVSV